MKNTNWNPRVVLYAEKVDDAMVYFAPRDKISVEGNVTLQQEVLHLCTGRQKASEITKRLEQRHSPMLVNELLSLLHDFGAVIDAQDSWKQYHELSCNPLPLFEPISPEELKTLLATPESAEHDNTHRFAVSPPQSDLALLLMKRGSSREFTDKGINEHALKGAVWSAYGSTNTLSVKEANLSRRTVPSAGALYPLHVSVVICKPCGQLSPGVYYLQRYGTSLAFVHSWDNMEQEVQRFRECFIDDAYIKRSAASIVISGLVKRETKKYGCRGYRYTILEAGHAAQNIDLFCAGNKKIGCVEVGGFIDKPLSKLLSLPEGIVPITTVFIGSLI